MTDVTIDAGTLTFSDEDLTATGLLVPYGVEARSNLGRFTVDAGVFEIPTDLTGSTLNIEHQREDVVGALREAREQPEAGILGTFKFRDTPEGRAAYEDAKSGKRRNLSAEVAGVRIRNGKAIAGRLFGAALVERPAFAGATLLAAEDTDGLEPIPEPQEGRVVFEPDESGDIEVAATAIPETVTVVPAEGDPVTFEPPAAPAEEPLVQEETLTASDAGATVPATLLAAAGTSEEPTYDLGSIFASVAALRANPQDVKAQTLLAALADITTSGTNSLPASGVIQPNWVGQLWQGKEYQRKFINQFKLGTDISIGGKKGYKIHRGIASSPVDHLGGDWAGNKTEVPTGRGFTQTAASTMDRFAFAADIAREFFDLPGGAELVAAFFRLVVEDYAIWSDEKALALALATAGDPVAPGTFPTEYPDAMGMLIQGILAVQRAKDTPSVSFVNSTAFEQLVYTPKDLVPEFVSFTVATEGTATADNGKVQVVEAPDSFFAAEGIDNADPAVFVGARNAIEFDELGSTPLTIDALDIAKGGVDRAIHGYLQKFVVRPEALILLGTPEA